MKFKAAALAMAVLFCGLAHAQALPGLDPKIRCAPPPAKDGIGHCDFSGYILPIPFTTNDDGGIVVGMSVNGRNFESAQVDTGASSVNIDDLPTTDELKGAATGSVGIASGKTMKTIANAAAVCVLANPDVAICREVLTTFSGADSFPLFGNSFLTGFSSIRIDRGTATLDLESSAAGAKVYILVDRVLYEVDNLGK